MLLKRSSILRIRATHLNDLVKAYNLLQNIEDDHWKSIKFNELENLITAITGLYLEASSEAPYSNPGSSVNVNIEAVNRSNALIKLKSISIGKLLTIEPNITLKIIVRRRLNCL